MKVYYYSALQIIFIPALTDEITYHYPSPALTDDIFDTYYSALADQKIKSHLCVGKMCCFVRIITHHRKLLWQEHWSGKRVFL